ncbi:MAG: Gldg family protein [Verrucomicrobiota bacterium]
MNGSSGDNRGEMEKRRPGPAAGLRGMVMGLVLFAAGIAVSMAWFLRAPSPGPAAESAGPRALSEATKTILQRLSSPVEIRFYSLLNPAIVGESTVGFSSRVDQLISQYERQGGGKIKVTRVNAVSDAADDAATADGIRAFNLDKGDASFLGVAIVSGSQKQSLPSLAPEWEQALESDISRAIAGVDAADPRPRPAARKADAASLEAVRRAIPNLDSVSVEEGTRMLRAASITQVEKTAWEMQAKITQAEERFIQAHNSQSSAEEAAALKELRQVQKEREAKLGEIAFNSRAQVEALEQLKGAAH